MVWINFIFILLTIGAAPLPKLMTKHSPDALRYISMDGRFAYLQKKSGVLGLVSSFRSVEFLSEVNRSDFLVTDSRFKRRLLIEVLYNPHQNFNLVRNNKILITDWGKSQVKEIGFGKSPRLHLDDEWVSYYSQPDRVITLQNVITQKKYQIRLSPKTNPFFIPEVEMVSADTVVYSEVNEKGYAGLIQYNLVTQKGTVLLKSSHTASRFELCQGKDYLAIGEFPYEDIIRSSKILHIKLTGSTNLAGYNTVYSSTDSDLGNMLCMDQSIFFIKTLTQDRKINLRQTEVVKLNLNTTQVQTISDLENVTQIIAMDGRVMIPFRGEFYVIEGAADLTEDRLKVPSTKSGESGP